jgi:hypothetical protein
MDYRTSPISSACSEEHTTTGRRTEQYDIVLMIGYQFRYLINQKHNSIQNNVCDQLVSSAIHSNRANTWIHADAPSAAHPPQWPRWPLATRFRRRELRSLTCNEREKWANLVRSGSRHALKNTHTAAQTSDNGKKYSTQDTVAVKK